MPKKLVTINTAADILGVTPDTLRHWDNCGKLIAQRGEKNNYRLYDISKLQKFIKQQGLNIKKAKRAKLSS